MLWRDRSDIGTSPELDGGPELCYRFERSRKLSNFCNCVSIKPRDIRISRKIVHAVVSGGSPRFRRRDKKIPVVSQTRINEESCAEWKYRRARRMNIKR